MERTSFVTQDTASREKGNQKSRELNLV